jgi:septum formation protein
VRRLVLASTSPYRRELLQRLALPFETAAPRVDESHQEGESPEHLVGRLAEAKARAMAAEFPDALIIGSDQCAELDGAILGKPGSAERAAAQLSSCSGRTVTFQTGVCVLDSASGRASCRVVPYSVRFRELTGEEIAAYIRAEQPLDCAGSFKAERLGIALFAAMSGDDPTALIGLPLISVCQLLDEHGLSVLTHSD